MVPVLGCAKSSAGSPSPGSLLVSPAPGVTLHVFATLGAAALPLPPNHLRGLPDGLSGGCLAGLGSFRLLKLRLEPSGWHQMLGNSSWS